MSVKTPKFQELVTKLREIFQIDRPELDFGIYRILNARADEINDYLEKRLPVKVQAALSSGSEAQREQVARELKEKEEQYAADGLDPTNVPKVQELRQKLAQYNVGAAEHENAVFSHLLTFFSRYYDNGDFISQRRYKGDTYAIPYAGEEVMLHWANKDQYYTKSGENFANYSFKLEDGRTVHFRLVSADTAKDNRKDNDKERRFALIHPKMVIRTDEEGEQYEEQLIPVEELDGDNGKELVIRFEYAPQPKGTKQDALVSKAVEAVLADDAVKARWLDLANRAPTEKNPQRTLLEKYLTDYTNKNTADYFIHKDLGGFLRRELDFYIKNEVMHLDDVQNAGAFADIEKNLRMIQCLRAIALELTDFLAQLEDFQKKLWLKKKFVVSSHYCITLDRVPEELYLEVAANERQWEQWKRLGIWEDAVTGAVDDLKANPYWMLDTSLFGNIFKFKLIGLLPNLDECGDGVLINSDNYQALRLIRPRFSGQVKCTYIDPPYNTGGDGFPYKDRYRDSSWGAMMLDRVKALNGLAADNGALFVSLDDRESSLLRSIAAETGWQRFGEFVWKTRNTDNRVVSRFSLDHEYVHVFCRPDQSLVGRTIDRSNFRNPDNDPRGPYTTDPLTGKANATQRPNLHYTIINEETGDIYPPDPDFGWITDELGFQELIRKNLVHWPANPKTGKPRKKRFLKDASPKAPISSMGISISQGEGNQGLADLMGYKALNFPKPVSVIETVVDAATNDADLILDCFAGSGTTAHAVVNLNRRDGGKRKYILVEQGDYFQDILKPRVEKVIYSDEWKSGKPLRTGKGISHCFKVLKLESYEDALNNLQLRRDAKQNQTLGLLDQQAKDDYLLHYMLDVESRGSLLSVEDFKKPFDYTMNIATDSAGAYEPATVDLVETFNYLIGLQVKHIDAQPERGFATVTGTLPSGESCLVLWRDCDVLDYEGVSRLCDKMAINPADNEFDVVYINGDHNIPTVLAQTSDEGGATRVLKLRQIEPEFLERMFSVEDV